MAVKAARRWDRISDDHEIWSAMQVFRASGVDEYSGVVTGQIRGAFDVVR